MKYNLCCLVIVTLCTVMTLPAQENISSLSNKQKTDALSVGPGAFNYFNASTGNSRITLNWAVSNNNGTDRFEIEKSTDGKNFSMIALVFGSELSGVAEYEFFEKLKKAKSYYRLKVIYKDSRTDYSSIILPEANPASN